MMVLRPLMLAALAGLAACGPVSAPPEKAPPTESAAAEAGAAEPPAQAAPAAEEVVAAPAKPIATKADGFPWPQTTTRATIVTSKGDILVELYEAQAPGTVANFLQYAREGHYDRLVFHRVVNGFVIQGGGYNQYLAERPTRAPVAYEGDNGLPNLRGSLAMARTSDPQSAASQFFINLRDNEDLDHFVNDLGPRYGYAVFGRVVGGMNIVDAIGATPTAAQGPFAAEVPVSPIIIVRVDQQADETAASQ